MGILNNVTEKQLGEFDILYVDDSYLSITRQKRDDEYIYFDPRNRLIECANETKRLNAIAVPPTYKDVLYCTVENGHILATGYDSTGKKQYFYHEAWAQLREATKFASLKSFGEKLPALRCKVQSNLKNTDNLNKDTVLAAMIRILDKTGMRVGNDDSAANHDTYGLTTLKKRHVDIDGTTAQFVYQGKGGMDLDKTLSNKKVADVIDHCAEIRGQRLFEFKDDKGVIHTIDSGDVNDFIQNQMGDAYSAKDFRTWRFSCYFMGELIRLAGHGDDVSLKSILETVSEKSGNTPSILQSSYIHPGLIALGKSNDWNFINSIDLIEKSGLMQAEEAFFAYLHTDHATQIFKA